MNFRLLLNPLLHLSFHNSILVSWSLQDDTNWQAWSLYIVPWARSNLCTMSSTLCPHFSTFLDFVTHFPHTSYPFIHVQLVRAEQALCCSWLLSLFAVMAECVQQILSVVRLSGYDLPFSRHFNLICSSENKTDLASFTSCRVQRDWKVICEIVRATSMQGIWKSAGDRFLIHLLAFLICKTWR